MGGGQAPEMEEEKEEITQDQSAVNSENNLETNNSTQIFLGLISPFIISFSLLMLFPPCLFGVQMMQEA